MANSKAKVRKVHKSKGQRNRNQNSNVEINETPGPLESQGSKRLADTESLIQNALTGVEAAGSTWRHSPPESPNSTKTVDANCGYNCQDEKLKPDKAVSQAWSPLEPSSDSTEEATETYEPRSDTGDANSILKYSPPESPNYTQAVDTNRACFCQDANVEARSVAANTPSTIPLSEVEDIFDTICGYRYQHGEPESSDCTEAVDIEALIQNARSDIEVADRVAQKAKLVVESSRQVQSNVKAVASNLQMMLNDEENDTALQMVNTLEKTLNPTLKALQIAAELERVSETEHNASRFTSERSLCGSDLIPDKCHKVTG